MIQCVEQGDEFWSLQMELLSMHNLIIIDWEVTYIQWHNLTLLDATLSYLT